jgi:F0F1-type ATP synthase epsilon subunit
MFSVKVFCFSKTLFDAEVDMVTLPGIEGDFSLLEKHVSFVTVLRPEDIIIYQKDQKKIIAAPHGGFVYMKSDLCSIFLDEPSE